MVSTLTIYVLSRNIDSLIEDKMIIDNLSHSALLLKYENPNTLAISYHLLEYNANNTVSLYNNI